LLLPEAVEVVLESVVLVVVLVVELVVIVALQSVNPLAAVLQLNLH
jgi:hypothetical protein